MRWVALLLLASAFVIASFVTSAGASTDVSRPLPTMLCPPAC